MNDEKISVFIISPEKVVFDGPAISITCHNEKGTFDILSEHSSFMSMIDKKIIIREQDDKATVIPIEKAILQMVKNHLVIMINVDVSKEDLG